MHAPKITPEIVLRAYAEGLFPMAERRSDPKIASSAPPAQNLRQRRGATE